MKLLVSGSREFSDFALTRRWLQALLLPGDILIHGAARGADTAAAVVALEMGIECIPYPADWDKYGKKAGPIRNQQMLEAEHPDLVLAFPLHGSRGTWDMMDRAIKAKVHVIEGNHGWWSYRLERTESQGGNLREYVLAWIKGTELIQ